MTAKVKQKSEFDMKAADFDAIMQGALRVVPEPVKPAKSRKRRHAKTTHA